MFTMWLKVHLMSPANRTFACKAQNVTYIFQGWELTHTAVFLIKPLDVDHGQVKHLNFYDIVLDFILMDSFEDLENPPISIQNVVNNRWLNTSFKETVSNGGKHFYWFLRFLVYFSKPGQWYLKYLPPCLTSFCPGLPHTQTSALVIG